MSIDPDLASKAERFALDLAQVASAFTGKPVEFVAKNLGDKFLVEPAAPIPLNIGQRVLLTVDAGTTAWLIVMSELHTEFGVSVGPSWRPNFCRRGSPTGVRKPGPPFESAQAKPFGPLSASATSSAHPLAANLPTTRGGCRRSSPGWP